MSKSTYMKWMTEAYLYEADDDKKKEHDKGDVWKSEKTGNWQSIGPSGDQQSFGNDKEAAEKHANPEGAGAEEKPKAEPKQTAISKTGGFGGDDEEDPIGAPGDVPVGELPDRSKEDEPEDDSDSEHASKVQNIRDSGDIQNLLDNDTDFYRGYEAIGDDDSGYEDDYGNDLSIDDLHQKIKMIDAGEDPEDFLGDFEDEDELLDAWKDSVGKAMAGKQGRTGTEEIKVINGKKYRAIKEEKKPKQHILKETYDRLFTDRTVL